MSIQLVVFILIFRMIIIIFPREVDNVNNAGNNDDDDDDRRNIL